MKVACIPHRTNPIFHSSFNNEETSDLVIQKWTNESDKFSSSDSEEETVRESWSWVSRCASGTFFLLAKAKETPHHVWLYHHTGLFTQTVETKIMFKVETSITLSNIHIIKIYQTKNATDFISALYSPNTYCACAVGRRSWGVALSKHSNIRKMWQRKRIQQPKVIIYRIKHESAISPSHIIFIATEHSCQEVTIVREIIIILWWPIQCWPFTVNKAWCQYILTIEKGHVNISPKQQSINIW